MANTSVAEVMTQEGVTQASLARTLGLHQSTVSRKLSGEIAWRVNELDILARSLGLPLARLLGVEPSAVSAGDTVSAAPTGVRRQQTSAGPARHPKQPPQLNGKGRRPKK